MWYYTPCIMRVRQLNEKKPVSRKLFQHAGVPFLITACLSVFIFMPGAVGVAEGAGGRVEISQQAMRNPPYAITQAGSYVLTSSLVVTQNGVNAIWVQADHVDLDLNGFTIVGPGVGTTVSALYQSPGLMNLRIHDGYIERWGASASYAINAPGQNTVVENMLVHHNARGILCGPGASLARCTAFSNSTSSTAYGLVAGSGSRISDCVVHYTRSTGDNAYGISAGDFSEITDCVVLNTSGALGDRVYGIYVGRGGRIDRCVAPEGSSGGDAYGICADEQGAVRESVASLQSAVSNAYGILCQNRARVESSVAFGNENGIVLSDDGTVRGCLAAFQSGDGFRYGARCRVEDNYAFSNAVYGFYAAGKQNQVVDNDASGNWIGFVASSGYSNFLARNVGVVNRSQNYALSSGNAYGILLTDPGPDFATEEAWANFSIDLP